MLQSPSRFDGSSVQIMVISNVIVDLTISWRSCVFSQLHGKVFTGLNYVSGLAITFTNY